MARRLLHMSNLLMWCTSCKKCRWRYGPQWWVSYLPLIQWWHWRTYRISTLDLRVTNRRFSICSWATVKKRERIPKIPSNKLTMPSMETLWNDFVMTRQVSPAFATGIDPRSIKVHQRIIFFPGILCKFDADSILHDFLGFAFLLLTRARPTPSHDGWHRGTPC